MAGDPINLNQVAKLQKDPVYKGMIKNIIRDSRVLDYLSFITIDSMDVVGMRWIKLPTQKFRKLGGGYDLSSGDVESVYESLYVFGQDLQLDRLYDKVKNYVISPRKLNIDMMTEAASITFKKYFFNGDHGTDVDGFEGVRKRLSNMPSRQRVHLGDGGDEAWDPLAGTAEALEFIDKFEQFIYRCNNGDVKFISGNEGMVWGIGRVLRYLQVSGGTGLLDVTKDQFDREIQTYKGIPLVDAGLLHDQITEVIPSTERDDADTSNDATSLFAVSVNDKQGIQGIQLGNLEIYDPLKGGEMESIPSKLTRMEWACGLMNFGSFGLTRLQNIADPATWVAV